MAKLNEFQTTVRFDVEGNAFREPLRDDNILATGGDLNELAGYDYFTNPKKHYTKSEILTVEGKVEPNFRIKDTDVVPSLANDYSDGYRGDQHVMLRSVSYKVFPGTFQIRMKTLGDNAAVKAQVFYEESETAVIAVNRIGKEDEYYPIEYDNGSLIPLQGRYYITIPSDVVLNTIGNSVGGTLQFTVKEFDRFNTPLGKLGGYNVGSVSAETYNQLVEGVSIVVPEFSVDKI